MTVKQLREALHPFSDDTLVEIAVHQTNKHYPIAYEPIHMVQKGANRPLRLMTWLPDGMYTVKRQA